jgi:nicotinamide riboside kinase
MNDTPAIVIAIVGAESTGKTSLARALAERLPADTGLSCAWVGEWLRDWCYAHGRTPHADEQAEIARVQHEHIAEAARTHALVIADTTPLMTAVYSDLLFDDRSLYPAALAQQQQHDLTLLTALDLPWVADGDIRDGPHVRQPVDDKVRAALGGAGIGFSVVSGFGDDRLHNALNAITPLLLHRHVAGEGLFTRLREREAALPAWQWVCDTCDVPGCEHATLRQRA